MKVSSGKALNDASGRNRDEGTYLKHIFSGEMDRIGELLDMWGT